MKTIYVLIDTTDEAPPESFMEHISNTVLVYDCNKGFIGEDTYNLKLNRWMISRDTAKYWLKKVELPSEERIGEIAVFINPDQEEVDAYWRSGFIKCAYYILNLLK